MGARDDGQSADPRSRLAPRRRRLRRIVYAALAMVVGVPLVASVAVAVFVDADYVVEQAGRVVHERTGLTLTVSGLRAISLLPRPGGRFENVRLGDAHDANSRPLFGAQAIEVRLTWSALLDGRAGVAALRIDGMRLDLVRAPDGRVNWPELRPSDTATEGSGARWSIGSLALTDAAIAFNDASLNRALQVDKLDLEADDLRPGASIEFRSQGELALAGGRAPVAFALNCVVKPPVDAQPWKVQKIDFDAVPVKGSAALTIYPGEPMRVSGELDLERLEPRTLMQLAGFEPPRTRDPGALASASISARFDASADSLRLETVALTLDNAHLNASIDYAAAPRRRLRFDLDARAWDIDRYRKAAEDDEPGMGIASANVDRLIERLSSMTVEGRARADTLTVGGTTLGELDIGVRASGSRLRLSPLTVKVWHARHRGDWSLSVAGDRIRLEGHSALSDWRADRLLEDFGLDSPLPLRGEPSSVVLDLQASSDIAIDRVEIESLSSKGSLAGGGPEPLPVELEAQAELDRIAHTARLRGVKLRVAGLRADANLELDDWRDRKLWSGQVRVAPFVLRELLTDLGYSAPATNDPQALGKVELEATLAGDARRITLEPLAVKLDASTASGRLSMMPGTPPAFEVTLDVDVVDADRYRSPGTGERTSELPSLPAAALGRLNLNGSITIGTLKSAGATLQNLRLEAHSPLPAASSGNAGAEGTGEH
ncbi:MAG: AsmA family protein [Gammaproteobacteria bacterium]